MLQLNNNTPFAADIALFPDEQGVDSMFIMVKASFTIDSQWTLVSEQPFPVMADEYWSEPAKSSLKSASDYHTGKPATDIILTGHARAPGNQPVAYLDVSLRVGVVNKSIRVFGDRYWTAGQISSAEPFTQMPLLYENAFGGEYILDDQSLVTDARNPVGKGWLNPQALDHIEGMPLPNLEDPAHLIKSVNDHPDPCCFAYVSPSWQPRADLAGSYDSDWEMNRAPYLPDDFNRKFLNMAHRDLIYPGYLKGGEAVIIDNVRPNGPLEFTLPRVEFTAFVELNQKIVKPAFNLETLLIQPDLMQLSLSWKAKINCDKQVNKIRNINIMLGKS